MPRTRYTFYIDDDQLAKLRALKERDGVTESEQIRRAVAAYLAGKTKITGKKPAK